MSNFYRHYNFEVMIIILLNLKKKVAKVNKFIEFRIYLDTYNKTPTSKTDLITSNSNIS